MFYSEIMVSSGEIQGIMRSDPSMVCNEILSPGRFKLRPVADFLVQIRLDCVSSLDNLSMLFRNLNAL